MGSTKKPTNRKAVTKKKTPTTARKKSTLTESAQLLDAHGEEWKVVGKLTKADFKTTTKISPADTFHDRIIALDDTIKDISEIGVSPATNAFFEQKLRQFARKKYDFLSDKKIDSTVAFAMLQYSPCDIEGAEDFVLYKRRLSR